MFKHVGHDQVIQEGCVLLPDFVLVGHRAEVDFGLCRTQGSHAMTQCGSVQRVQQEDEKNGAKTRATEREWRGSDLEGLPWLSPKETYGCFRCYPTSVRGSGLAPTISCALLCLAFDFAADLAFAFRYFAIFWPILLSVPCKRNSTLSASLFSANFLF